MGRTYKLFQVIPSVASKNGGPTFGALAINRALAEQNVESVIFALNHKNEKIPKLGKLNNLVQFQGGWLIRHLQFFYRILTINKIDSVLIHGLHRFSSWGTAYFLQVRKIPYFVQLHGTLEEYEVQHHRIRKKLFMKVIGRRFLQKSAFLLVASTSEGIQARKQIPGARVETVPLGASIDADSSTGILPKLKEHFLETPLNKRLLFLGRLARKKHPEIVIEIIKHLPDYHLVLAGPEDYWSIRDLLEDVTEMDLSRISYVGLVDEPERKSLYELCGIFLLPSENENFGIAIAEASLGGLYCVTSHQVASSEYFEIMLNGVICSSLEVDEWVLRIQELDQYDFTVQSRETISNHAKQIFSWQNFSLTLLKHASALK